MSPPSGRRGRGEQTPAARGQLSSSGEATQPAVRAGRAGILEPTLRPGEGNGSGPSSHFGSLGRGGTVTAAPPRLGEGEGWGLGKRRGVGTSHASNGGEVSPPRRLPTPTIPRNSPVSSRFRSGTSACVCERRERGREKERDGGARSPDTDSPRGLNWSHLQPPPPPRPPPPPPQIPTSPAPRVRLII